MESGNEEHEADVFSRHCREQYRLGFMGILQKNTAENKYDLVKYVRHSFNVERSVLNHALQQADAKKLVKRWECHGFRVLYENRCRMIYMNLNLNPLLCERIMSGDLLPTTLQDMTHQDLCPEKWQKRLEEKTIRDELRYKPRIEASTDMFTCRKCKKNLCTYYQLQTRSADEPMTTFVTCISEGCGSRWKC